MDFKDLIVYKKAFSLAMEVYEISKKFPKEEKYSLTDQTIFQVCVRKYCGSLQIQMQRTVKLLFGLILLWNVTIWIKKITLRCCTNPLKLDVC